MLHYMDCGLDYVWLENGFERVETPQGAGVRVRDLPGLLDAIADYVVSAPRRLRGQEVRFLRSMLDLSQGALARVLGQARPSVARWEGNRDKPIPGASDRALRLFYAAQVAGNPGARRMSELLKELDEIENGDREERFRDEGGWKFAA